jgi:CheY-like chemotaxis protein
VAADPSRLQQIVWNLLWNAIKFTPEGGSVIVRLTKAGSNVEITVSDTGLGISKEFLPHLFERFQQASPSITRRFGGLGLGLSIVKYLVDMHGGTVSAKSEGEGKGATFTVVLPAAGDPHVEIVLVEDDVDTLDFLARYLTSCGAHVTAATTAAEALASLPRSKADILVSDIGLPEMDGYDLIHRVRTSNPPIALTAYARPEDRARSFRAGFQAHLAKPIEAPELAAAISRLVGRSDSQSPAS